VVTLSGDSAYVLGSASRATVTIVSDEVAQGLLTIGKAGSGTGRVTSGPAGIDCGLDCAGAYPIGTVVTLTAVPDGGRRFAGWSLTTCPGTGDCTVTVTGSLTVTATFTKKRSRIVVGTGSGSPLVQTFESDPAQPGIVGVVSSGATLAPYAADFRGGVFVAQGDLDGDGEAEVVTGTGPGGGPHVRAFHADGQDTGLSFMAYDPAMTSGVRVASCDVDGDGVAEIVTAPGPGFGPHVRIWRVVLPVVEEITGFFAYAPSFSQGLFVACGDVDGDGRADVITAAGPGGGPHVRAWRITALGGEEIAGFMAYDPGFRAGLFVAAGDVDGDGRAEIITGAGAGGGPHVRVWAIAPSGAVEERAGFMAYDPGFTGGMRVAAGDVDGDGLAEVITGAGPGGGPHVRVFRLDGQVVTPDVGFFAFDPTFTGGIYPAGATP
jgi:hypothetical protein